MGLQFTQNLSISEVAASIDSVLTFEDGFCILQQELENLGVLSTRLVIQHTPRNTKELNYLYDRNVHPEKWQSLFEAEKGIEKCTSHQIFFEEEQKFVLWGADYQNETTTEAARALDDASYDHGMAQGITMKNSKSLYSTGLGCSLAHGSEANYQAHVAFIKDRLLALNGLLDRLSHRFAGDFLKPIVTPREVQVIEFVTNGYLAKEIAYELEISQKTVEHHLANAKHKLNARNITHMATIALSYGLVKPVLS